MKNDRLHLNTRRSLTIAINSALAAFILLVASGCAGTSTQLASVKKTSAQTKTAAIEPSDKQKYQEIRQHLLNKEYTLAEAKLQAILAKFPNQSGALANLGLVYSETGRLEQAEEALKKSIKFNNNNAQVYLRLASVYKKQGNLIDALKAYKKSIEIDTNNAKAHYNIAILYDLYLQDEPKAIKHLKKYMDLSGKQDADTVAWLKQLERTYRRQKTAGN